MLLLGGVRKQLSLTSSGSHLKAFFDIVTFKLAKMFAALSKVSSDLYVTLCSPRPILDIDNRQSAALSISVCLLRAIDIYIILIHYLKESKTDAFFESTTFTYSRALQQNKTKSI